MWFVAINYGITLLKELNRLAKHFPIIKISSILLLIGLVILHHNFFPSIIIKLPNHQIIKLLICILVIRIPFYCLRRLLSDSNDNDTENSNSLIDDCRYAGFGVRAARKVKAVNGISSFKTIHNFIWTLILLLISGNQLSHHLTLCAIFLCAFFIFKSSRIILKNLKIC